jgi:tetratricopeptide (TPR) repeat protein
MTPARLLLAYAAVVVALQVFGGFNPGSRAWGFHHWAYLPLPIFWGAATLAALLLLPPVQRAVGTLLEPLARALDAGGRARLAAGAVIAGFVVLFIVARQRLFLLSDGDLLIGTVREGLTPLAFTADTLGGLIQLYANILFVDVLKWPSDTASFRIVAVLSGVAWLGFVFAIVGRLTARGEERLLLGGLLAFAGLTRFFYGYVETGPLLAAGVAFFLWAAIRVAQEGKGLPLLTLAMLLVALLHVTGLLCLPAYAVLLWRWSDGNAARRGPALALMALPVAAYGALWVAGGAAGKMVDTYAPFFDKFLAIAGPVDSKRAYTLLSPTRWTEWLNEQYLLGPFAVTALLVLAVLARKHLPRGPEARVFTLVLLPFLALSVLFNREIGGARDWDLLANVAVPALFLVGLAVVRPAGDPLPERARGGTPGLAAALFGAALLHLVPWVLVDTSPARSLRHFLALFDESAPVSRFARSYALEGAGHHLLAKGFTDGAMVLFEDAAASDPANSRASSMLGTWYSGQGDFERAVPILEQVVRQRPDVAGNHYNLGSAYLTQGRFGEAGNSFAEALRLNPRFQPAYLGLANVAIGLRMPAAADSVTRAGLERFPEDAELRASRAIALELLGRIDESIGELTVAVERAPDNRTALFNLGRLLNQTRRFPEAVGVLERLTHVDPNDAEAWSNLGVAYLQLERNDEAVTALGRAIGANPTLIEPYRNLAAYFYSQGRYDEAIGTLESFVDKAPEAAAAARVPEMIAALRQAAAQSGRGTPTPP